MAPEVSLKPSEVAIRPGSEVTLECSARGVPRPVISWSYPAPDDPNVATEEDTTPLGEGSKASSKLRLPNVRRSLEVKCVGRSVEGSGEASTSVRVTAPGSPPINIQVDPEANRIRLNWDAPEIANEGVEGYRIYYQEVGSGDDGDWQTWNFIDVDPDQTEGAIEGLDPNKGISVPYTSFTVQQ